MTKPVKSRKPPMDRSAIIPTKPAILSNKSKNVVPGRPPGRPKKDDNVIETIVVKIPTNTTPTPGTLPGYSQFLKFLWLFLNFFPLLFQPIHYQTLIHCCPQKHRLFRTRTANL